MINPTFWAGRRVLVTGHTGFKGAWLSWWLHHLGAEVVGFSLPPVDGPTLYGVTGLGAEIDSRYGDVVDPAALSAVMAETGPSVVLHLAAQALVRPSYDQPVETFATNVVGTANLLHTARSVDGLKAVVSVTSDKCYENNEWDWGYRENEPMGGHDPYSASKGCAELVTAAMRRSYFDRPGAARIGSARAGNVIGGGDWAQDRLVPDMIRAFGNGEEVVIRRPEATRPWQHVLEPLSGYLLLAERLADGDGAEGWNFGPLESDTRPVSWIVERLAKRWGQDATWRIERDGPHEATMLKLDCSKAHNHLGWRPRLDLEAAIDWVVDWYRAHLDGGGAADMRSVTLAQIDAYQALPPLTERLVQA